jgi:hypothetical protein
MDSENLSEYPDLVAAGLNDSAVHELSQQKNDLMIYQCSAPDRLSYNKPQDA